MAKEPGRRGTPKSALLPFNAVAKSIMIYNRGGLIVRFANSFRLKSLFFLPLLAFLLLSLPTGAAPSQAAEQPKQAAQPPMRFVIVRSLLCQD